MQRLFTTFPNGLPGAGLLLLRIVAATPFVLDGLSMVAGTPEPRALGVRLSALVSAALLLAGLWTPLAAVLQTVTELSLALTMPALAGSHLTRAAIGLALAALGPGAWSVDSCLYGRKRIKI
jgi:putative oxidoreductase